MRVFRTLFGPASPLGGVILAAAAFACALGLRYGFIEPEAMGAACEDGGPAWCVPRTVLIVFTEWNGFGWLALVFLVLTVWPGRRGAAWYAHLALGTAGAGMVLYNATFSAAAAVLAILWLARHREETS